jgi:hypothetical protein
MWRLAAALVLAAASALYDDVAHVTKFTTSEDAEKAIFGDDANVYIIHFYQGPNDEGVVDEHSPTITAAFAGAAKELADLGVKAACIDVADESMLKIAKRFNLRTVPHVVGVGAESRANPYTGKIDRAVEVYEPLATRGSLTKTEFKRWVSSKVFPADSVARVASKDELAKVPGPLAVLLTERATTSALAKSLGVALRGRLSIIEVQSSSELGEAVHGDESLPRFVASKDAMDAAALKTAESYEGDLRDRSAVLEWLETFALKERRPASSSKKAEEAPKEEGWPAGYSVETAATKDELEKILEREPAVVAYRKGASVASFAHKVVEMDGADAITCVEVDCESFEKGPVCEGNDYVYYPYGEDKTAIVEEDGAAAFGEAALSLPVADVFPVSGKPDIETFLRLSVTHPDDGAAPVGLVVFAKKHDVSPTVRAAATTLARHAGVRVAQWSSPSLADVAEYGVQKLPALLAFYATDAPEGADLPPGQKAVGAAAYPRSQFGPVTFMSLLSFMSSFLQQVAPETAQELIDGIRESSRVDPSSMRGESSASSAPTTKGPTFADLNDPINWEERCGAKASAALCAVALLDEHGRAAFADENAIAEGVAKSEQPSPFAFGWVDGACHSSFAASFDVDDSKLPTVIAYAPKKERYAALVGRYSAADVRAFLRGVLRGSIGTAPLRAPLNLEAADCAAVHAAKQAPVEEEDALDDDFMAELLAEEAAAKKALEEEAAAESKRLKEELEASKKKPDAPKRKKKKKKKKKSSEL